MTVAEFPALPCEPAGEDDYADDFCHYCKQHNRLVCSECHRHTLEDENSVAPGEWYTCPVHGRVVREGQP